MATFNIVCGGPGPHIPADGILGTSDRPPTADVRCSSPSCVKPPDVTTVNQQSMAGKLQTALTANANDLTQDATIQTQAAAITGTAGTFTLAQLTTFTKQLAQAVSTLAGNDVNTKKELGALIHFAINDMTTTTGT